LHYLLRTKSAAARIILQHTMAFLDSLQADLKYAWRQLGQSKGFTTVAVLSLALGMGANTAIFQLVDVVRLRTLPIQNPQELVYVDFPQGSQRSGWFSTRSARFTHAQWQQIQSQQQAFSGMAAWSAARFNMASGGEVRYAEGLYVNGDFFRVLGVNPIAGRLLEASDDTPACGDPAAVISYAFWMRELGGNPGAVGSTVTLEGRQFPIAGITPASFFGVEVGRQYDVAIPLCADRVLDTEEKGRAPILHAWWISMMGRLKPGWTVERADSHLKALAPGIMRVTLPPMYRSEAAKRYLANKLEATSGETGVSGLRREYEKPLWLLLTTTGLVLLIACANLTNLLLARASVRGREVALRLALGASRGRLVRQLLVESLLLAFLGAAAGIALAQVLSRGLISFLTTENSPLFLGVGMDLRVLAFTLGVAVVTCVLFGLVPALRATHVAPVTALRSGGRSMTAGPERFGLRRALVATQVALSLVLLVGSLLFARSLQKLMAVDPGFRPEGIVAVELNLTRAQYAKEQVPVVLQDLLQRVAQKPGIAAAAQVAMAPISGSGWNGTVLIQANDAGKESFFNRSGPGYFRTMGTSLQAGRDFTDRDNLSAPKVAIVNEVFASRFFDGANPVGRTFRHEREAGKPDGVYEIVGLVRNTKYYGLREDFRPIAFYPVAQDEDLRSGSTFVVRTAGPAGPAIRNIQAAAAEVSPAIGLEIRVMSRQIQEGLLREKLMATLSTGFGLLAGLLATLGLYGVIAYQVARRRNEIGLRVALGADRGRVIRLVLREAVVLLAVGVAVGLLLALWAGRAASTLLYGLEPHDPMTLLAATALLSAIALAASYVPARRAAALEPMAALREE
jgi:predicted permease